jgi:hypothetical protein
MGLLDEAIREHLELKRRRGGDPTEIAREEREALDPVFPEAAAPAGGLEPDSDAGEVADPASAVAHQGPGDLAEALAAPADFSSVGEETAELDMQAVLEADEQLTEEHPARGAEDAPPELDPGQERLSSE